MKKLGTILFLSLCSIYLWGQSPPATGLYLFDFERIQDSQWVAHSPKFLTGDNPDGYNNQPAFLNDHTLLFTQQKRTDSVTNIVQLDLKSLQRSNLSQTGLSEYSPTVMPKNRGISVIRVERDGWQTLWQYDLSESGNHRNLFPDFKENLGYHSWLTDSTTALFVLGEEPTLRIGNIESGKLTTYTSNIGRCLKTDDQGRLLYLHRYTEDHLFLKKFDPDNLKMEIITELEFDSQDFEIIEDRYILLGNGPALLLYDLENQTWLNPIDLSPFGITHVSRLAYRSGRLVLVNNPS